jgi:hypothetical protein
LAADRIFVALGALDDDAWREYFEQTFKLPCDITWRRQGASTS